MQNAPITSRGNGKGRALKTMKKPAVPDAMKRYFEASVPVEDQEEFNLGAVDVRPANDPTKLEIVLPSGMSHETGRDVLNAHFERLKEFIEVDITLEGWSPLDAMVAATEVLNEISKGIPVVQGVPGFFGRMPPRLLNVKIDNEGNTAQVLSSAQMKPPVLEGGHIEPCMHGDTLWIHCHVRQQHKGFVQQLESQIRARLAAGSIYKGKAIEVDYKWMDADNEVRFDPLKHAPKFLRITKTEKDGLILPQSIETALAVSIFSRLEARETLERAGIPFRHGVLLAGEYGVGKSLCAEIVAKTAVENGVTFLKVNSPSDLALALRDARRYQPAVVFMEDVDKVVEKFDAKGRAVERSEEFNKILNTIDSAGDKEARVMVVFTTNRPDSIHPSLLRAGRIDRYILLERPDAEAAMRLIKLYCSEDGGSLIDPEVTEAQLLEAATNFAGMAPAFVSTACYNARVAALISGRSLVTDVDLADAAIAIKPHQNLVDKREKEIQASLAASKSTN